MSTALDIQQHLDAICIPWIHTVADALQSCEATLQALERSLRRDGLLAYPRPHYIATSRHYASVRRRMLAYRRRRA